MTKPVAIIMGSQSDWETMKHAGDTLDALKKAEQYVEAEEGALNKLPGALGIIVTALAVIAVIAATGVSTLGAIARGEDVIVYQFLFRTDHREPLGFASKIFAIRGGQAVPAPVDTDSAKVRSSQLNEIGKNGFRLAPSRHE